MSYDADFFSAQSDLSRRSAERVVPLVVEALHPVSVVDVGCGVGTWLTVFEAAGCEVQGLDGDYVDRAALQIPADRFQGADLRQPVRLGRRFDLAVSLEVAEHLPPARAESFVADLCELAPAVLFSGAVPLQGGTDHVNERWQDEWVQMFQARGYRPVDLVRPRVWNDVAVAPWYAQNTILYVTEPVTVEAAGGLPWRVVHPRMWLQQLEQERGRLRPLAEVAREVPGAVRRAVGR